MNRRIVVVGSGTGGTLTANLLAKELRREIRDGRVSVELLGEGPEHYFQPASLDVAFKGASPVGFSRDEEGLLDGRVKFIQEKATMINLNERVVTTRDGRKLSYDYLVIATGAEANPDGVPGLKDGSLNFHTGPHNAKKIWEAINWFKGGKVVVAIAGTPHKCPPSPNEAAFMLHEFFRKMGIRDRVEIKFLTPYPRAYPAEKVSHVVESLFKRVGIEVSTFFNIESVDPTKKKVYSLEGDEFDYDLLIAVPPHSGAKVIKDSGIGDADGWVPTDKKTMLVNGYDDAFCIGDATNIPVSKSGVVAHLQSNTVALNISSSVKGLNQSFGYNGRINCPMEVGHRKAIFVSATYTTPPSDQVPSFIKYIMKKSFGKMYWTALRGSLEPVFAFYFGPTTTSIIEQHPIYTTSKLKPAIKGEV
jgi:sulfide:quinone oxidoreductase